MPVTVGTRVGPYEIMGLLGKGGMGVVYRARDTGLQRDVALKLLPDHFADDSDRLTRFQREAQLLASVNHPNIAQIYGLEELNGIRCIVMELLQGETLRERLSHGPIPVDEALPMAKQIAEALEAAHEKGVVHRDLKPANIKITPEGKVKVLDFGLAKAVSGDALGADLSQSDAVTAGGTLQGVILGTPGYMSPEQVRGKTIDKRADIWSFGCVLYELLARRPAFEAQTISDTIAKILEREPDWRALPDSIPLKIRDLLRRCFQKDPIRRLRDIGDARIELEEALGGTTASLTAALASSQDPFNRRPLAAVFSDLGGASMIWSRTPRERMVAALGEYRYIAESISGQYGALHCNFTGDGHLFLYENVDAAVRFSLKLLRAWIQARETVPAVKAVPPLPMRVGCHVGICARLGDSDAFVGSGAVLAKRIEDMAGADSVYVTESVLDLIDLPLYRFEEAGTHRLKGDYLAARNLYRVTGFQQDFEAAAEELNAEAWFLKGVSLIGTALENSEEEADCYRAALRLRPDYPEAHNNLGILLKARGEKASATVHYQQALRLRPNYPEAHYNYAILLQELGRLDPAADHFREALRLRPEYVDAHCGYANLLAFSDQVAGAKKHYEEALRLRPEYAEAHNNLAVLLERQGDSEAALHHYEEAIRIRPDEPEAHYNYAMLLEEAGMEIEAENQYRSALRLRPAYAEAHNNLAVILQKNGRLAEAEEHYAQALQLRPNDPQAHYNYGLLLRSLGKHSQADHHFGIAFEIAPEVAAFREAIRSGNTE